jgi:hypothetical protein
LGRKEKEREKEKQQGVGSFFFSRAGHALLAVLCGFLKLLGAIKGCFKGQSLNLIYTCNGSYYFD